MPARGANASYVARKGRIRRSRITRSILVLHRFRPLVQAAVHGAIRRVVVVAVFLNHTIVSLAIYRGRRVNHSAYVQVLRQPTLGTNLDSRVTLPGVAYRLSTSGAHRSWEQQVQRISTRATKSRNGPHQRVGTIGAFGERSRGAVRVV